MHCFQDILDLLVLPSYACPFSLQLSEEGFNCALYWENPDVRRFVSVAPTSALTGEGIADLIHLICSLNETLMKKTITKVPCIFDITDPASQSDQLASSMKRNHKGRLLQCTILEVKAIEVSSCC